MADAGEEVLHGGIANAGAVVRVGDHVLRRIENGEQAFIDMYAQMGGAARYERRVQWFAAHRARFLDALS